MVDDSREAKRKEAAARLRQAREDAKFKDAQEAADHFGWKYTTYRSHESQGKGGRAFTDFAEIYASAFGTSAAWLLFGDQEAAPGNDIRVPNRVVPLMSMAAYDELIEVYEGKKPNSNRRISIGSMMGLSSRAYAIEVSGLSMVAPQGRSFEPGVQVLIDPEAKLEPGCFVHAAVERDGRKETLFRKFTPAEHGSFEVYDLVPLNRDFAVISVPGPATVRILGRAVRYISDLL
jgi:SOS-response transcriptional repressor LexA